MGFSAHVVPAILIKFFKNPDDILGRRNVCNLDVRGSVGVKIRPCRDLELLGFVLLFFLVPSAG